MPRSKENVLTDLKLMQAVLPPQRAVWTGVRHQASWEAPGSGQTAV